MVASPQAHQAIEKEYNIYSSLLKFAFEFNGINKHKPFFSSPCYSFFIPFKLKICQKIYNLARPWFFSASLMMETESTIWAWTLNHKTCSGFNVEKFVKPSKSRLLKGKQLPHVNRLCGNSRSMTECYFIISNHHVKSVQFAKSKRLDSMAAKQFAKSQSAWS